MTKAHAIIAGGGTAGHVVPGLAIASELVARGVPPETGTMSARPAGSRPASFPRRASR